jgi:hypothetical protein
LPGMTRANPAAPATGTHAGRTAREVAAPPHIPRGRLAPHVSDMDPLPRDQGLPPPQAHPPAPVFIPLHRFSANNFVLVH